jgi:methyl-accepting chemotaxis protein
MAEKLKDIKETASDAVEIIRELGSPDVQESLEKIREVAKTAREIIESLKDPAMVTNFENIRKTVESIDSTSARLEKITMEMKNSGILDEAKETIKSAKDTIGSFGTGSGNMGETIDAIKEMLRSISGLVDELKLTVASSKKDGIIHNAEEAIRETRSALEPPK